MQLTVVVVDEESDASLVQQRVTTKGECLANEVGTALTQRVIETFDVRGFARFFADWTMSLRGNNVLVHRVEIAVTDRSFAIISGK